MLGSKSRTGGATNTNWPGKIEKFHQVPGKLNFHWVKGENCTGSGFTGSVKNRRVWQTNKGKRNHHILGSDNDAKLLQ